MWIVYLDQNKWIELARAEKFPAENALLLSLLEDVKTHVDGSQIVFPLTSTNIYETQKINNQDRRLRLARLQARLSRGLVFCCRRMRLKEEFERVLRSAENIGEKNLKEKWFLSDIFFEAFGSRDDKDIDRIVSDHVLNYIKSDPSAALFDYLMNLPDQTRMGAVRNFSTSSGRLQQQIEDRRKRTKNESFEMRRRFYSALLLIDEIDFVLELAVQIGLPWKTVSDVGQITAHKLVNDVPTLYVEREMVLRLESQSRAVTENDLRDMQAFCAIIPYAQDIVAEKQFVNLAHQAGLHAKYDVRISTDTMSLRGLLDGLT